MTKPSFWNDWNGEWVNRLCGRITKTGKRCRAHAALERDSRNRIVHLGCYLHDPRRETHRQWREREQRERGALLHRGGRC
jgi:hypothetical protein